MHGCPLFTKCYKKNQAQVTFKNIYIFIANNVSQKRLNYLINNHIACLQTLKKRVHAHSECKWSSSSAGLFAALDAIINGQAQEMRQPIRFELACQPKTNCLLPLTEGFYLHNSNPKAKQPASLTHSSQYVYTQTHGRKTPQNTPKRGVFQSKPSLTLHEATVFTFSPRMLTYSVFLASEKSQGEGGNKLAVIKQLAIAFRTKPKPKHVLKLSDKAGLFVNSICAGASCINIATMLRLCLKN